MSRCVSCGNPVDSNEAVVSGDGVIHESCLREESRDAGSESYETVKGRIAGSGDSSRWGEDW